MLNGTVKKIVDLAVQIADPDEVILFGSIANGTSNVYSDIDLLIIGDSGIRKKELANRIRYFAGEYALKADVLVCTPAEFEQEQKKVNSFISAIYKDGRIVYKKRWFKIWKL